MDLEQLIRQDAAVHREDRLIGVTDVPSITNSLIDEFISKALHKARKSHPEASYLEVGCGTRRYAKHLPAQGWKCVFTDFEVRGPGVSAVADAHRLPFRGECFDVVLMTEVLEHLHDPEVALSEISRVLRPEGLLILTYPFNYSLHETPYDFTRWTEFKLEKELAERALTIVSMQRRGNAVGVLLTIISHLVEGGCVGLARAFRLSKSERAFKALSYALMWPLTAAYLTVARRSARGAFSSAGDGLSGVRGHLQLWHLGYHVVCRKPA